MLCVQSPRFVEKVLPWSIRPAAIAGASTSLSAVPRSKPVAAATAPFIRRGAVLSWACLIAMDGSVASVIGLISRAEPRAALSIDMEWRIDERSRN
jgi:hypothetical protein